jgi:hypothetical protein
MLDTIINNFWTIAAAVLSFVFVGYITWRNNFKTRRAAACAAFRSAVLAELGSIYPNVASWPENIDAFLRSRFSALQTAVENFRPFVPWWRRWLFDRAWFRYRCATGRKIDVQCYHHYMAFSGQPDPKITFYSNVSRLLSFANET